MFGEEAYLWYYYPRANAHKEKSMKKIMFALIAIAILFASCSNPVITDYTDDMVVGTWVYTSGITITTIVFNDDGSGTQATDISTVPDDGVPTEITWSTDNGILTLNTTTYVYTVNATSLTLGSTTYTRQ